MASSTQWRGTASIRGSTEFMRMALLTFCLVGLQFTWGIEMTYCTPYLLELGLTKSKTSLVWIAGPLSGIIMAPLVGALADRSKSRWGRRRPFMVGGSLVVALCLIVLGWSKEITQAFMGNSASTPTATILLAVFSIYALDFAINAVQWSCRSLIIDTLPIQKQQAGSAWASVMVAVGNLLCYGAGAIDLELVFGTMLGDTQFKRLTIVAGMALGIAVSVTCYAVTERVRLADLGPVVKEGNFAVLGTIIKTTMNMPDRIQAICWVQFWAWIGWFPFLFYSATWVGETYFRFDATSHTSTDMVGEVGRIGSTALILFSIVTFTSAIVIPRLVEAPEDESAMYAARPALTLAPIVEMAQKKKPSLLTMWYISQFIFAGAMFLTPFVTSFRQAEALVAITGIPWALASWCPHTYMGQEIIRMSNPNGNPRRTPRRRESNLPIDLERPAAAEVAGGDSISGIYLGILNLFTTIPQFIGTFISMIVFSIFENGQGLASNTGKGASAGVSGISVCLFIGALCAVVAAYATRRLQFILV